MRIPAVIVSTGTSTNKTKGARTMSVLIKGMELPKDCPYCKMAYYNASDEFTGCAVVPDKRYAMHNDAVYAKSTQRPDWCPLVEIPEPKEGYWIEGGIYRDVIECYCSECGQIMTTAATVRMNYCPRCGADMRGEQHG
jgi:hypothetical protein